MVYMLLGTGFEETEAIAPLDLLRRAGVEVQTVGINGTCVTGSHGITVQTDILLQEMTLSQMQMLILPGGLGGVASIRGSREAMAAIGYAWEHNRFIAAICAAPTLLQELAISHGKNVTCFPACGEKMRDANLVSGAAVVRDGCLITGTSAGCAISFGLALIEALKGREEADRIAAQIVIR